MWIWISKANDKLIMTIIIIIIIIINILTSNVYCELWHDLIENLAPITYLRTCGPIGLVFGDLEKYIDRWISYW